MFEALVSLSCLMEGLADGELAAVAFAMDLAIQACAFCAFALLCLRLGAALPAWDHACRRALGRSWLSLARSVAMGRDAAHPGRMLLTLAIAASVPLIAASRHLRGTGWADALRWSESWGRLAAGASVQALQAIVMEGIPLLLVAAAIRDDASPVGAELQAKLAEPGARRAASKERSEILDALPAEEPRSKGAARL